jgi:hypothetical protein
MGRGRAIVPVIAMMIASVAIPGCGCCSRIGAGEKALAVLTR